MCNVGMERKCLLVADPPKQDFGYRIIGDSVDWKFCLIIHRTVV